MKPKKCKVCNKEFEPKKYATCKTKCEQCIKEKDKIKRFEYLKKQFEKPLKPPKQKKQEIDKRCVEISKEVKERDKDKPCISCGKTMQPHEIQAGHFIPRSKCKELYYDLRNIHAQCWECNNNHQKQQETHQAFRKGLIARYSLEYVEVLETIEKRAGRICKTMSECWI